MLNPIQRLNHPEMKSTTAPHWPAGQWLDPPRFLATPSNRFGPLHPSPRTPLPSSSSVTLWCNLRFPAVIFAALLSLASRLISVPHVCWRKAETPLILRFFFSLAKCGEERKVREQTKEGQCESIRERVGGEEHDGRGQTASVVTSGALTFST